MKRTSPKYITTYTTRSASTFKDCITALNYVVFAMYLCTAGRRECLPVRLQDF